MAAEEGSAARTSINTSQEKHKKNEKTQKQNKQSDDLHAPEIESNKHKKKNHNKTTQKKTNKNRKRKENKKNHAETTSKQPNKNKNHKDDTKFENNTSDKTKRNDATNKTQKTKTCYMDGKKKLLTIWYTNADTLTKDKVNELTNEINQENPEKPDIICITEFKPKNFSRTLTEQEYKIEGYEFVQVGIEKAYTRGVAIYVNSALNYVKLDPTAITQSSDVAPSEILCLEIPLAGERMLLTNMYRSPNTDNEGNESINNFFRKLRETKDFQHIVILGDFNRKGIVWDQMTASSTEDNNFIEAVRDSFLFQHIREPTRGRGTDAPSLLDLLFTMSTDDVENIEISNPLGKSDHALMKVTYRSSPEKQPPKQVPDFRKADFKRMKSEFLIDWEAYFEECNNDINQMWEKFYKIYNEVVARCIPQKTVEVGKRRFRYFLDRQTLSKRKRKYRLWKRYMESKDGKIYQEYCRCRNQLRRMTRKAIKRHEKEVARKAKNDVKPFWSYVNSKTKLRSAIPPLYKGTKDEMATDDSQKANVLGNFFTSVYIREPPLTEKQNEEHYTRYEESRINVTKESVNKRLSELNPSKSPGPDKMHPRVLKELADELATPLKMIFNTSIRTGKIPKAWKEAYVTAVYKNKGDKHDASNYRPISLTCIACKMLEAIIRESILDYMKDNKILSNKQFGFLGGRSTILQLLKVFDKWADVLDKGGIVDTVYFDFQKAFDTVPHERLLNVLQSYGLSNELVTWIKDFLVGRRQCVCVNGKKSDVFEVPSGVPQGSVLGPILFVIYINTMIEEAGDVDIWLYADDTKLFREIKDENQDVIRLQNSIDTLHSWSDRSLLKFHPDKCEVMRMQSKLSRQKSHQEYSLDGEVLKNVSTVKDLGITFDSDLTFETHIRMKVNKANSLFGMVRRSFTYLDCEMFKRLFTSVVRPHLEYGACVWNPHQKGLIKLIEDVQRRATKTVPGLSTLTYQERLKRIGIPTLMYRRYRGDMIEIYKLIKPIYDEEVAQGFLNCRNAEDEQYDFRSHNHVILIGERFSKDVKKYSFRCRTVGQWNYLPKEVAEAPSLNAFKQRLDKLWKDSEVMFDSECNLSEITSSVREIKAKGNAVITDEDHVMNLAQ